ncbi:TlyA family rRNA (cytidine-2'-O)-methyltransferase [Clostridia bacterium]|nr:TlyA family rRNA (cytidine-2'-O)-methyltransferase [Clostridia bacterium]
MRIDVELTKKNFASSRTRARELIEAGYVTVNGVPVLKPSQDVDESCVIEVLGELRYVSRGGYKLETALEHFPVNISGKVCMDIGASTGGFTDCLLQNGAAKIYAVDIGERQLHDSLLSDNRVVSLENTDIRNLSDIRDRIDFCVIDVSFISIKLIIPHIFKFLADDAVTAVLIKPQFEAGNIFGKKYFKNGIIKDGKLIAEIVSDIEAFLTNSGYELLGSSVPSKITGKDGNQEYVCCFKKAAALRTTNADTDNSKP